MIRNQNVAKHRSGHRRLSLFLLAVFLPVAVQLDLLASLSKFSVQKQALLRLENTFKGEICTDEVSYDLVGNRLAKSTNKVNPQTLKAEPKTFAYYYNANDQLLQEETSVGGDFQSATYAYDANGSLISKIVTPDPNVGGVVPPAIESATYTYNLENRLSSAQITRSENDQDLNITANYLYNQSGIRVKADSTITEVATNQQIAETNRTFLIDSNNPTGYAQVLEEYNPQAMAPTVSYTLGTDIISQATHTPSSTNHSPSFLLYDGHGSTRLVTDSSGSITDRMSYDAYGMMLGLNPTSSAPPTTAMLYSGEQFDVDLQQQYLRARYYDQTVGVFNRLDPFGGIENHPQSFHKYVYADLNPVNNIDPSGLYSLTRLIAVTAVTTVLAALLIPTVRRAKTRLAVHGRIPAIEDQRNSRSIKAAINLLWFASTLGASGVGVDEVSELSAMFHGKDLYTVPVNFFNEKAAGFTVPDTGDIYIVDRPGGVVEDKNLPESGAFDIGSFNGFIGFENLPEGFFSEGTFLTVVARAAILIHELQHRRGAPGGDIHREPGTPEYNATYGRQNMFLNALISWTSDPGNSVTSREEKLKILNSELDFSLNPSN